MKVAQLPFEKTGFFSKTMLDYLAKKESIKPFYHNYPDLVGFRNQLEEKEKSFNLESRNVLSKSLEKQYQGFDLSEATQNNIKLLKQKNTFTVTTGHQLNLFTGPLYFLYKIFSTINLAEEISKKFPTKNIVPVYWMATEDHDFEEINYFNFQEKKVQWNLESGGAVGRLSTEGLSDVFEEFSSHLGSTKNAKELKKLFSEGYLKHKNLADATRFIANELFKDYGLVILDGDDLALKKMLSPIVKDELENETSFHTVSETILALEKNYKVQVNPRAINLFYLSENSRERILFENGIYKINNTNITFSKEEILREVDENPLAFSPNVIVRPLYQEVVLPNLCYIGGGGEIAYWLELKSYFEKVAVPFPILLLRNSVQIVSEKQQKKLTSLKISHQELFLKQQDLLSKKVLENTDIDLDFNLKIESLQKQFTELKEVAKKTDISFVGAVNAQEKKQIKGLENLQRRLLRAEKRRQKELVDRITDLQRQLLPNQSLEERQRNFSDYYLAYGTPFLVTLKKVLKPLAHQFTILEL
ncbi:MAG: bacillithiol biosynthesis cysteine-adding enzyme BshC [Polaribacter sp.]|jgi:bacillithiol biosynthesis cysteine-adding enzyme BshC|nr:bacillithiol biosynthesis cysteine-adding enzyme BshC [Polaribacter sp.]MBT4779769.1 bacillithiol biosynthesis cysteine-adding enzyme BshC [Polaribacter sp.]MBT5099935.1 bacillithiol biosynthesis cysteine-adding enzyme BshC [Polaribacter sp.]MBT5646172.1 bacillithiol biosynthesis cysteine-adding enzyme BshC [Polaribacter sp.]MDA9092554.1 bacillithiol biosynthesis cysteine-adding enzyme BshC [Polaribacter sp.]MDG1111347.1 bacillithiol biosynthesis cysteine-adding enzyme BshC [Polaribacter sp